MLKSAGTNLILLLIAASIASQGAYAAPLPRLSLPKFGGGSKPSGTPPKTTNSNGEPVSFFDTESLLDKPVKATSDTVAKAGKAGAIAAGVAGVVGGGVGGAVVASQNPGLGYDYSG